MTDFAIEKELLTEALKQVSGYRDCEKLIVRQILAEVEKGRTEAQVESYLKNLAASLERKMETTEEANIQMNYRYVVGFINTLLKRPSWKSFVQTIDS